MKEIRIKVQCTENEHHAKILKLSGGLGIEYAETLAGLLDGSSPFYVHRPGGELNVPEWPGDKGSPIGRCGICGARYVCSVLEIVEPIRQGESVAESLKKSLAGEDSQPGKGDR